VSVHTTSVIYTTHPKAGPIMDFFKRLEKSPSPHSRCRLDYPTDLVSSELETHMETKKLGQRYAGRRSRTSYASTMLYVDGEYMQKAASRRSASRGKIHDSTNVASISVTELRLSEEA